MPEGEKGGSGDMLTASPWGTKESGAGGIQVGTLADGSNDRKSPSAAAKEAGMQVRHGARQEQGGKNGGHQEKWEQSPQE